MRVAEPPAKERVMAMRQTNTIDERILYRLSLDFRSHELAEALLDRFRCLVGDLPASENHHHSRPGGLYQHSLEVALQTLEQFAGTGSTGFRNMAGQDRDEQRGRSGVDSLCYFSFSSSHK